MMNDIQFNKLTLKNFLSFGNKPISIDLRGNRITTIMGINHDSVGAESRNGTGKSSILDAMSYVMYGKTLRDVSNSKLVNKLKSKGQAMLVVLDFDTADFSYRIERGESPSKLKLFKKPINDENNILLRDNKTFVYDVSRNKTETTDEIENIIGFDITLFEFLMANTTESIAFMKLPEPKRKEIAEHLMGLNLLSEKAVVLKSQRKDLNSARIAEHATLETLKLSNNRVMTQIDNVQSQSRKWENDHNGMIADLESKIKKLTDVNIDDEIEILTIITDLKNAQSKANMELRQINMELNEANRKLKSVEMDKTNKERDMEILAGQMEKFDESICPTCNQHWVADKLLVKSTSDEFEHICDYLENDYDAEYQEVNTAYDNIQKTKERISNEMVEASNELQEASLLPITFSSIIEANSASNKLDNYQTRLTEVKAETDPYITTYEQLLNDTIQNIDNTKLQKIDYDLKHYNYLIDLLQNKDSFLRRNIIDGWLPQINSRINHYLEIMELPYVVRIKNDLGMEITSFNTVYDFGNLSKGQRQRVTIALNLAFQDSYERSNKSLSLLMIDELLDAGLDARGASQVVTALQEACAVKNKRVMLITHRQDIAESDNIEDTILVELKHRISTIDDGLDDLTECDE